LEDLDDEESVVNPLITLRSLGWENGIEWGTAVDVKGLKDNDQFYQKMINQQFDLLIPDYGMYMSEIQKTRGNWDFSRMDMIVEFARKNNKRLRGHALIYDHSPNYFSPSGWHPTPDWVRDGDFSRTELIGIMREHIETVLSRYKGDIDEWVIVNESVSSGESEMNQTVWRKGIGEDYVDLAFQFARQAAPNATLILNENYGDYLGQETGGIKKPSKIYNFVSKSIRSGAPIDAIGLQFHLRLGAADEDHPTLESLISNFYRFKELGIDVFITELDVAIKNQITSYALAKQAELYEIVVESVMRSNACNSIALWGYSDKYSWLRYPDERNKGIAACLFDDGQDSPNPKPKPAFYSVIETMQNWDGELWSEEWVQDIHLRSTDLDVWSETGTSTWNPQTGTLVLSERDQAKRWHCHLKREFSFQKNTLYRFHVNGTGPQNSLVDALFVKKDGKTKFAESQFYWESGYVDLWARSSGTAEFRMYFGNSPAGVYKLGN
jgi:GH35 family endo-1,4-beta-xylanase